MVDLAALVRAVPMGNAQRNERALALVMAMMQGQPVATDDAAAWAHAMGAWRFLDNPALDGPTLYAPVHAALQALVPPAALAYVVHDLSPVDYSGHNAKPDRLAIGDGRGRGYELYTALVLDAHGRPLGPVYQALATADGLRTSADAAVVPAVDHFDLVQRGRAAARAVLPDRARVHVYDREFDDVGDARAHDTERERSVVRVSNLRRRVRWQGTDAPVGDVATAVPLRHAAQVAHADRTYEMHVGATTVTLTGPSYRGRHRGAAPVAGPAVTRRLVVVELRHPTRTVRWALYTDLDGLDPVAVAQIYVWRWRVERFFYLTKVGLKLEAWTQAHGAKIARRLALASLAALVLYQLHAHLHAPAAVDVVAWVARAGGWLGRRRDPLGPVVLMRGIAAILAAAALLERYGVDGLRQRAAALADVVGLPIAGTPRARPRRRAGTPTNARAGPRQREV